MNDRLKGEVGVRIHHAAWVRDGRCLVCGKHLTEDECHTHHIQSRGAGGKNELINVITLCPICHTQVHNGTVITTVNDAEGQHEERVNVDDHVMNWLLKLNHHYLTYDTLQLGSVADSQAAKLLWGRYRAQPRNKIF